MKSGNNVLWLLHKSYGGNIFSSSLKNRVILQSGEYFNVNYEPVYMQDWCLMYGRIESFLGSLFGSVLMGFRSVMDIQDLHDLRC